MEELHPEGEEMTEVKVAELTTGEVKYYKVLQRMKQDIEKKIIKTDGFRRAFWDELTANHHLRGGNHYVVGNKIYKQELDEEPRRKHA